MKKIKHTIFKAQSENQRGSESISIMKNFIHANPHLESLGTPTLTKDRSSLRKTSSLNAEQLKDMVLQHNNKD